MPVSDLQNVPWNDPASAKFRDALIRLLREYESELVTLRGQVNSRG